jgi:hypothetical protein
MHLTVSRPTDGTKINVSFSGAAIAAHPKEGKAGIDGRSDRWRIHGGATAEHDRVPGRAFEAVRKLKLSLRALHHPLAHGARFGGALGQCRVRRSSPGELLLQVLSIAA